MAEVVEFTFKGDASDLNKALRDIAGGAGKASAATEDIGKKGARSFGQLKSEAREGFGYIKKVAGAIALVGAAAVAAAANVLITSQRLNQLAKDARRLGTSASEVDKFTRTIGLLTDGSVDAVRVFESLDKRIAEAKVGTGEATPFLKAMGLSLKEIEEAAPTERLALLADGFQNLGTRSLQTKASLALFEEAGGKLLPAFRAGRIEIEKTIGVVESVGVVSDQAAADAEMLADQWDLLKQSMTSANNDAVTPLIPVMNALLELTREFTAAMGGPGGFSLAGQMVADAIRTQVIPAGLGLYKIFRDIQTVMSPLINSLHAQAEAFWAVSKAITFQWDDAKEAMKSSIGHAKEAFEGLVEMPDRLNQNLMDSVNLGFRVAQVFEQASAAATSGQPASSGGGGGGDTGGEGEGQAGSIDAFSALVTSSVHEANQLWTDYYDYLEATDTTVHDARMARLEEERLTRANNVSEALGMAGSLATSLGGFAAAVATAEAKGAKAGSDARRSAAEAAWKANTAAALVQAALNVPLAISQASAGPYPAAIAQMVIAGIASGAALAGVVAKAANKPKFHSGGLLPNRAPDEIGIIARQREAILNPAGVAAVGGRAGVDAANRGQASAAGGPITVVQKLNNRIVDAQTHDSLDRFGSPLSAALRETQTHQLGSYNPFGD